MGSSAIVSEPEHSSLTRPPAVILSCEHGGSQVPEAYAPLFRNKGRLLRSHRALDTGSLPVARILAERMKAPLYASETSRLLVDLNRSVHHRNLFSEITRELPRAVKARILKRIYLPYRRKITARIGHLVSKGSGVVHISVHSFVPVLEGKVRNTDIGLLYDPGRTPEKEFCRRWKGTLQTMDAGLRTRCNYPYLGRSDGFTTWLRHRFSAIEYLGIELELNQRIVASGKSSRIAAITFTLAESLSATLKGWLNN